jgi:hypothetical protein
MDRRDSTYLYVIPTTRLCAATIENLEHDFSQGTDSEGTSFLLLDQCDGGEAKVHHETLVRLAQRHPQVAFYHVLASEVDARVHQVVKDNSGFDAPQLERCFLAEYSYGMAANRISLVAAALGASSVHRRDSDVRLQFIEGAPLRPYEVERTFIGRSVGQLKEELNRPSVRGRFVELDLSTYNDSEPIQLVGGAYKGDWPIDYADLADNHLELLHDLIHQGRPTESRAYVEAMVRQKLLLGTRERYERDELRLPVRDMIEVGNYSLFEIFKQVPVPPVVRTSGIDYFYHSLLEALRLPLIYHNRRVLHEYSSERKPGAWSFDYYAGLAMFRASACYYRKLYADMSANRSRYYARGVFNTERLASELMDLAQLPLREQQRSVLSDMCETFERTGLAKYRALASGLRDVSTRLIDKTAADIESHAALTRHWRSLIFEFEHGAWFRQNRLGPFTSKGSS